MTAKKKVQVKKVVTNQDVSDDVEDLSMQTIRGVMYPRPQHYAATPNGGMAWIYDVDNYPDKP